MALSQPAFALRQTYWGLSPMLDGKVMAAQDLNLTAPHRPDGAKTLDDWHPSFYDAFYRQSQAVSSWEVQQGEFGRGLFDGRYYVDTKTDGRQLREENQLGRAVFTPSLIAASSWTNNTSDGKKPNYYHRAFRPQGAGAWRNGHGVYVFNNNENTAWATSAQAFLARDNNLKAAFGYPANPLELAARVYAAQYNEPAGYVNREGNAAVAQGNRGRVHIENLGFHSADELLAVIFSNINTQAGGRPFHVGHVPLSGDKAIPNSLQGLAVAVGRDGQWIFDYLSALAWGGMETAVPRFYAKLDEVVARATGNQLG